MQVVEFSENVHNRALYGGGSCVYDGKNTCWKVSFREGSPPHKVMTDIIIDEAGNYVGTFGKCTCSYSRSLPQYETISTCSHVLLAVLMRDRLFTEVGY